MRFGSPLGSPLGSPRRAVVTLLLLLVAGTTTLRAQGFSAGHIYAGPRIWTGNLNGATAIGVQAEKALTAPGTYGPGIIAAGAGIDRYSWSASYPGGKYEYAVTPIQLFSNYHLKLASQPKLDPYAGLALVYQLVSASVTGVANVGASSSSTDIAGQIGARYFLTEKFAVQGQVGFGYGTLSLGATWRF